MFAGLPGIGVGTLFYVLIAMWMPLRELPAIVQGRSSWARWRVIGNTWYLVPGSHNGLLYEVTTTDPAALSLSFAGIILVALAAAAVPARRVGRVDPVLALRSE